MFKLARIAVETPLEDVKHALEQKGHEVFMFTNEEEAKGSNLAIVRTLNEIDADAKQFEFPFVSMEGMSVEEIVEEVEERLNR
ncbi:YkuS family protein [Lederbergia sp. NSJ-179]|uniref:YkuS family protein n=1 Tax=Lederbergia sp. NSJ-179 TaxID=2931402 RepID=UPI001FD0EC94|nr:YkuS family protein [Lederbergia sp. NSJ-179]MCJ7842997.1 YkuS family protein [Lederbergia sp. NSJ-179]